MYMLFLHNCEMNLHSVNGSRVSHDAATTPNCSFKQTDCVNFLLVINMSESLKHFVLNSLLQVRKGSRKYCPDCRSEPGVSLKPQPDQISTISITFLSNEEDSMNPNSSPNFLLSNVLRVWIKYISHSPLTNDGTSVMW